MSNDWIYIGADRNNYDWSKIGKTTVGLDTRHTSSQNPGYFIHTAFKIMSGDVHEIESMLKIHLGNLPGVEVINHFSTGTASECFLVNPKHMTDLVESFINAFYSSSVAFEPLTNQLQRFEVEYDVFDQYKQYDQNLPPWCQVSTLPPKNLNMTGNKYFPGNLVEYESDLGDGYFVDNETGMQGYRDEDGNVEWTDWK